MHLNKTVLRKTNHWQKRNRKKYSRGTDEDIAIYGIEIQVISEVRKLFLVQIWGEDHSIAPACVCMCVYMCVCVCVCVCEREREETEGERKKGRERETNDVAPTRACHVQASHMYTTIKDAPLQTCAKMVSDSCTITLATCSISFRKHYNSRRVYAGFQFNWGIYYTHSPNLEPSSFTSKLHH